MFIPEMSWQQYSQQASIASLPLHEQVRKYNIYINEIIEARMEYLHYQTVNAQSLGSGASTVVQASYTGDLTLVFSNFETVDVLLAGGFDSLSDWNTGLVDSGTPYTSISVDEGSSTIYLSGGSNITLKQSAFTGVVEGGLGLGEDLISIVDNGTIIDTQTYAFYGCSILEIVNLPALTSVASFDFYNCVNLRTVQLPLVTTIGEYGFFGAFNTANSPMTLYLPSCIAFGSPMFLQSDGFGGVIGTTDIDLPKVMNATFSTLVSSEAEITYFLSENSGVVATYV